MVAFMWVYSLKSNRDLMERVTAALAKADNNYQMLLTWGEERGRLEAKLTDLLAQQQQTLEDISHRFNAMSICPVSRVSDEQLVAIAKDAGRPLSQGEIVSAIRKHIKAQPA